ncbi:MAG: hypothetical protein WD115_01805, partial [Balneolaceae bacterium]
RDADGSDTADWLIARNNEFDDPQLGGICRTRDCGTLNPVASAPQVTTLAQTVSDSHVDQTTYIGAFDPSASTTWISGWTTLARYGYLSN